MHWAIAVLQQGGARDDDPPPPNPRAALGATVAASPPPSLDAFLASVELKAYHLARNALWDREAALDVVQDSMMKLVERYAAKPAAEWPALFFTIVHNRINDARRHRQVRAGIDKVVAFFGGERAADEPNAPTLAEQVEDPGQGPEQALGGQRLRAAIDAAMQQLPARQCQVFILREWQELSVKDTAQILGCSEGTVKQHHFRALRSLRGLLAEVWRDE